MLTAGGAGAGEGRIPGTETRKEGAVAGKGLGLWLAGMLTPEPGLGPVGTPGGEGQGLN